MAPPIAFESWEFQYNSTAEKGDAADLDEESRDIRSYKNDGDSSTRNQKMLVCIQVFCESAEKNVVCCYKSAWLEMYISSGNIEVIRISKQTLTESTTNRYSTIYRPLDCGF